MSFFNLNFRSARSKIEEVEIPFSAINFNFAVIILTETWFDGLYERYKSAANSHFFVTRNGKWGGGVSLVVNTSFACDNQNEFAVVTNDYETVAVVHGTHMFVGLHRPPSGCFLTFSTYLEGLLEFETVNKLKRILGGDFAVNVVENSNKKASLPSIIALCLLSMSFLQLSRE